MVDACVANGILPFYGPVRRHQGHRRLRGPVPQRLPARLRRRLEPAPGADRHRQAGVQPRPADVAHARRVIEAMGDGTGAVMLDGKMEDDASVKQCQVMVELADALAAKDPELAEAYGFAEDGRHGRRESTPTTLRSGPAARSSTCRAPTSGRWRRPRACPPTP